MVYAIPTDGADRSAEFAQKINDDVDQITGWWSGQDPTRAPRFDVTPFSCGNQVDLTLVRLPQAGSQLAPRQGRATSLTAGVMTAGLGNPFGKYLVYYDGPADEENLCGEGGGAEDAGPDYAFVYTAACTDVPTAAIAAHELLHALSALPDGAPHGCPRDDGHPCDSEQDVLYPFASGDPLSSLVLDVGHDDYYAHSGNWFDLQDSIWLTHLGDQVPLSISVRGGGKVVSLEPAPDCTAACSVQWNRGTTVQLEGIAPAGKRFVRWSGGCKGTGDCTVTVGGPTSVGAFFALARFRLSVAVTGKGLVRSTPRGIACVTARCGFSFTSYRAVRLNATAAKGWRFARWTGSCSGARPACSVPMTKAASARAVFVRR